ncbi:N-6 DNA methylase [Candidatus Desantisbacteria bacterium]|nr:N-6 DNA methylase [Candidatus Desantisbacteria bacterium]
MNKIFSKGLETLGFDIDDDAFVLNNSNKKLSDPQLEFHIKKAESFQATAVYLRKQLNGSYKPQVYLYDYTGKGFNSNELTKIQKKIWSSGDAPLACIFYSTEIKILDCTKHIKDDNTPEYLIESLKLAGKTHELYNKQFAVKVKSGVFWEEEENKNKFKFTNSAYDKLINNIRIIIGRLKKGYNDLHDELINKLIIQSILIKYLEERIDDNNNKLLSNKFFKKYGRAGTFNDVLRKKGKIVELLIDLNDKEIGFNGNIFYWDEKEKSVLKGLDLSVLAELLETNSSSESGQLYLWRYFEFKYIPVELISRLYEEFLGKDKRSEGLYYTPSHLVQLLVDEALPLKKFKEIDLDNFQILDPACGSGIFLVIVFKRLVQIWRLQHKMNLPGLSDLKKLLKNIYGIDKEKQAVRLASFSLCLALCNELEPIKIINDLKFDDLRETNIIESDFFIEHKLKNKKFDLIIGNPPFNIGALKNYSKFWDYEDEKVKIPQGQIALKFLSDSLNYLQEKGLLCLIIKASSLLYNHTSEKYKQLLFSKLNVIQVLDFTALASNNSLWENGADVATAAIFIRKEKPDFHKNILHLTFRRTKATKERIVFEIDEYDLHFINRQTAIENKVVWKNNLLGGGRIKSIVDKNNIESFKKYLVKNNCKADEGFKVGSNGKLSPKFIYEMQTLPTDAIDEDNVDLSKLGNVNKSIKFEKIPNKVVFTAPNILIKENIGVKRLPIHLNKKASFSFQHKIVGISHWENDIIVLAKIISSFEKYNDFYRFYIFATSGQVLVNKNTAILKTDIMQVPFIGIDDNITFSDFDNNIINDVNIFMQDFIRHGENSEAVKQISKKNFKQILQILSHYGNEFSKVLNLTYENKNKKFRLSDVVKLDNSFIATIFKYDNIESKDPIYHEDNLELNLKELSNEEVSKHLNINRIIKLYSRKDTIIFIKPNQYRYWLSLIAYRDADKCFSDLAKLGY